MVDDEVRKLAHEVIAGFELAAKLYKDLSGGWEVHRAPEYYCTVKIGEKLYEAGSGYVTLEQNIADTLRWAGGGDARPTRELPRHGRFDIALWGPGSEGIHGIVEVKEVKFVTFGNLSRDVARVCKALTQTKSLKWGMVAYYASLWDGDAKSGEPKTGYERLKTRTDKIEAHSKARAKEFDLRFARLKGEQHELNDEYKGGVGRAEVLVFYDPNK